MKFLITLLTMLAMQTICSAGDQDKHKDMMIVLHGGHDLVLIHISTKELIVFERGRKTKKRIRKTTELNELESKKIWALLENVNRKEWEGLWINYNFTHEVLEAQKTPSPFQSLAFEKRIIGK